MDRLRNVFTDEMPGRSVEMTHEQQLHAERVAGRGDVVADVTATLEQIRDSIRADWTRDALDPQVRDNDLYARYEGQIDVHNRVAYSMYQVGENTSVPLPALIHPEELQAGVQHDLQQRQFEFEPQSVAQTSVLSAEFDRSNSREITADQSLGMGF
jgi:hypothetical protein